MNFRSFSRFFGGKPRTIRKPARPRHQRPTGSTARLLLETLEDRYAPSTLPAPLVTDKVQLDFYTNQSSVYGPQVVMDPINPDTLVEVHAAYFDSVNTAQVGDFGEIWGNYSFDRGETWASTSGLFINGAVTDPATGNAYPYITNVSVTFDRTPPDPVTGARNFYVVSRQHNAAETSGAIVFNKFTIDPANGIQQDFTVGSHLNFSGGDIILYRWFNADPAYNPFIAIDNNEASYIDPVTGLVQTDSMATLLNDVDTDGPAGPDRAYGIVPKAIYVAWNTRHVAPQTTPQLPDFSNIIIAASADGGNNFSTHQFVTDNTPNFGNIYTQANSPKIFFSQGTPYDASDPNAVPRVPGGILNIMYNDTGTFNGTGLAEIYIDQTRPDGGDPTAYAVSAQSFIGAGGFVSDSFNNIEISTEFILPVNIGADGFTTLADLDVELHLQTGNTSHLLIQLIAPSGQMFTLVENRLDVTGGTRGPANNPFGLANANDIGIITGPNNSKRQGGTWFDLDAPRSIRDGGAAAPWVGHFRPESGFFNTWASLYGSTPADLNGDWTLRITDFRNDGNNPPPQFLHRWGLHFTSNIDTNGFDPSETFVATAGVRPAVDGNYPSIHPAANPRGISPGHVAAYDNTLGASRYAGRLYVAYVSGSAANPNISIRYSDDGGASWSQAFQVNDDSSADNFSEGTRAQFLPALAVDPVTGAVVVSYYDGRFDAAGVRVANSIAVSIDGGRSYSPTVLLNDIKDAGNFLTGETVEIEPIPGNQALIGLFGFGDRQGLAVYGGRAIPVFSTNLNGGNPLIRTANVLFAAGPRVVFGDMGPVVDDFHNPNSPFVYTYNNTYANDGTRQFDGFVVTFDRPVNPATFEPGDVTVIYRDPLTGQIIDISTQIQSVTPLDIAQQHGVDDAATQPAIAMGDDAMVIEGNSGTRQAVFKVYLTQPLLTDVTFTYATQNITATAGQDYVAKTGTVTIPAGQTVGTFTVDVIGDTAIEGDETFRVNLTSVTPGMRQVFTFAIGRIIDDDGARRISIGDAVLQEGNAGTRIMSFPVVLSTPDPVNQVTVNYFTSNGTATAGVDYQSAVGTVTFAPGQTTAQIDIAIIGDQVVESSSETFGISLFGASGALISRSFATGWILDDDDLSSRPTIAISDALVLEGNSGTVNATFKVVISQPLPHDVAVSYMTVNGSATAGPDYEAKANQVVIPAGQTSATFNIVVKGDTVKEGNETFRVMLTGASANVTAGRVIGEATIVDDDGAPAITLGDAIVQEGTGGARLLQFPIAMSVPNLDDPVTVSYSLQDGTASFGADFSLDPQTFASGQQSTTFTFAVGETNGFINVVIHSDQIIEPGNEQFTLTISNAINASIARGVGTGTIVDDDVLGLTAGDVFIQEGVDGPGPLPPVFANVVVYLNAPTSEEVTFTYQTTDVTATAGLDYTATSGTGTIPAGQTSVIIQVPILYDTLAEPLETFLFEITSSTNAALVDGTATITIVDNDQRPDVTIGDLVVREDVAGGIAQVPVFLSFPVAQAVTVTYTVTGGPALPDIFAATAGTDYVDLGAGTLVIPAGSQTGFIQIQINNDNIAERTERLTINLNAVTTPNAELSTKTQGALTIVDNDVSVSIGDVTRLETNGNIAFTFPLFLSSPSEQQISVTVQTADGSAQANTDYQPVNTTVLFAPGQIQQSVQVIVLGNAASQGNRDFFLNITAVTGNVGVARTQGLGTIIDDDGPGTLWSISDATFFEGDAGNTQALFTVFLSQTSTLPLTIQYSTVAGSVGGVPAASAGLDYVPATNQSVTVPAGQLSTTFIVDIVGELLQEGNEVFSVVLNPVSAPPGTTIRRGTGVATIVDDDQQVIVYGDANFIEGNIGAPFRSIPIIISQANATNVAFDFQTVDGTATAPSDYFSAAATSQIIATQSFRNVFVRIVGDTVEEGPESFSLDLVTPIPGILVPKSSGRVNIIDDDDLKVAISDIAVQEGTGGTRNAVFTVYLNGVSANPVNMQFTTLDGTARNTDYVPNTNGSLTIPAGARSATITVPVISDDIAEGNETFFVRIFSVTGAGIEKDLGTATIVDDDLTPALTIGPSFFREANGLMFFTVFSSFPVDFPINVTVNTSNGLATAGADYTAVTNQVLTILPGETSTEFNVVVQDDTDSEGNEDFTVTLSNPTPGVVFAADTAQGLIVDDEPAVSLNIGDALVKEGNNGLFDVVIPIIISSPFGETITVHYQTQDGSASAGSDYVAIADNILTIAPFTTHTSITVQVRGDSFREGIETFFVNLFASAGAITAKAQAVVTIVDDDSLYGATQFLIRLNPQSAVGTYSYSVGPDISDGLQWFDWANAPLGGPADLVVGNKMDQNNNSITNESVTSAAFQHDAFSVPHATLDVPFQGPYSPDSMPLIIPGPHLAATGFTNSTFSTSVQANIPTSGTGGTGNLFTDAGRSRLTVAGLSGQLADLNVKVNINYPNSGHLVLRLRGPNGQVILLANQRGNGNFYGATTFDDQAAASIATASGPFGAVRPESPLSALNLSSAEVLNGEWTLEVEDLNTANTGRILDWSMTFRMTRSAQQPSSLYTKLANEAISGAVTLSSLPVSGLSGFITDVNVRVNIDHPNSGSMTLNLVAPNGRVVGLASGNGDGNFFLNTLFDDQAPLSISQQSPHGPFYHVHPRAGSRLSVLNGIDATALNGNWQLQIVGGGLGGALLGWSLDISTSQFTDNLVLNGTKNSVDVVFDRDINPATFTAADVLRIVGPAGVISGTANNPITVTANPPGTPAGFAARTFRISFPTQSLSGTYQVTLGSNISAASNLNVKIDNNLNAGLDALNGGTKATGVLQTKTYTPSSPSPTPNTNTMPVVIPSNSAPGGNSVTVALEITDGFRIVQDPNSRIQVTVNITRASADPDLSAVLIAPDGTEIRLFTLLGGFTTGGVKTFDDFASTPVQAGGTVFGLSTFNPQIPLSRLQGKFTDGVWLLRITNNGAEPGVLNDWSLRFPHYVSGSGMGEPVADQFSTGFRIFTMDPTLPLSTSSWTAVGPAPTNQFGSAGRVTAIAVDPSDPSGNTVYIGGASGGVWKTTNFLSNDPQGPTYVPLTDLGPSNSLNIGHITIIPRNNDPRQSIILVGTGDSDTFNPGIGLLRSMNGGASWQIIDSTNANFDANGNPLPLSSGQRNRAFVGTRVNKIVVDPTPINVTPQNPGGHYLIYLAVSGGAAQGLYRSLDSGATWTLLHAGVATDVLLAPASAATSSGVLQLMYAAFEDDGVYFTTSAATTLGLSLMGGGLGKPSHQIGITPIPVNAPPSTPNGAGRGRILLATPAKTNDRLADAFLQNWLYAFVIDPSQNHGYDLYVTKDRGNNWTRVTLAITGDFGTPAENFGVPTNDENITTTSSLAHLNSSVRSGFFPSHYQATLAIDPNNPNIVYMSGTSMVKIDITKMSDPWAVVVNDNSDNDGGLAQNATMGPFWPGFNFTMLDNGIPQTPGGLSDPSSEHNFYNMYRDPYNPFLTPSTFHYNGNVFLTNPPAGYNHTRWLNDGTDVSWQFFNPIFDAFDTSSRNVGPNHAMVVTTDPLTGKTRIILGTDQGVFTGVDRGDGQLQTGVGTANSVRGSRNGNLQIAQFVSGAVQPSTLAADVAGALFYGMAVNNGTQASSSNVLSTGNLNWITYDQTGGNDLLAHAVTANGSWIMTDATGGFERVDGSGAIIFNPDRIGTTYQYLWPCCNPQANLGGDDFFVIDRPTSNPFSHTNNLLELSNWFSDFGLFFGQNPRPFGRFAINPLDPGAGVIGDSVGRLYRSAGDDSELRWEPIATPAQLGNTSAQAVAFGSLPLTALNLNDFIYAGTNGGRIFVTFNGGGPGGWTDISAGLDGSTVLSISPNPRRGARDVVAITTNGVYYMADSQAPGAAWERLNDTPGRDSLFNFERPLFNNPDDMQPIMAAGQITSLAVDWRYAIPDNLNQPSGPKHPVIYVGGNSGVFKTIDKGITWQLYPDTLNNNAPQEGGFLPNVRITDLDLMLGYLDPATGRFNHAASQNVLVASTYGRGAFAIRLDGSGIDQFLIDFTSGPRILSAVPVTPAPGVTLTGFDVTFDSVVDATTFRPNDVTLRSPTGQLIPILSVEEITVAPPGGLNPHNLFRIHIAPRSQGGTYRLSIGPNITDFGGNRMNQDNDKRNGEVPDDIFQRNVNFTPNTPPTISAIADQFVLPNTQTAPIPFRINDAQTPPNSTTPPNVLTLRGTSSNQNLVPDANILFVTIANPGNGPNRQVIITPAPGAIGRVEITIEVTDPFGMTASTTFTLTINTPPTLDEPDPLLDFSAHHTVFPIFNYAILVGSDVDPGAQLTYFAEAYADAALTQPLPNFVGIDSVNGQLSLTPTNFSGTYFVRAGVSDGLQSDSDVFEVEVLNTPPTLNPLDDITLHHSAFPHPLPGLIASGNDIQVEELIFGAKAYEINNYTAFQLDQQLNLRRHGKNFSFNERGKREKYFKGPGRSIYYILPNGRLFRFRGNENKVVALRGVFVHQFTKPYWRNPNLLINAQPPTELAGFVEISGGDQIKLMPPTGFLGRFLVEATVSDGADTAKQTFLVTVTNTAPFFSTPIGTVSGTQADFQNGVTMPLNGFDADLPDQANLQYSATAYEAQTYQAWSLDQQYKLQRSGPGFDFNERGRREKYFKGAGNKLFYILPNGQFFQFRGSQAPGSPLRGKRLAILDRSYWSNPNKLANAAAPTELPGFVSVDNGANPETITFSPATDFLGLFFVEAFVSDGNRSTKQVIRVIVNP
jgi:subtilisin-like proprotein convertase family protein